MLKDIDDGPSGKYRNDTLDLIVPDVPNAVGRDIEYQRVIRFLLIYR